MSEIIKVGIADINVVSLQTQLEQLVLDHA